MSDDWVQWAERASASLKQSRGITADEEDSRMYNYLRGWLAGQAGRRQRTERHGRPHHHQRAVP